MSADPTPKKRVNITINPDLHFEAVTYAKDRGMDFSELLSSLLRDVILNPRHQSLPKRKSTEAQAKRVNRKKNEDYDYPIIDVFDPKVEKEFWRQDAIHEKEWKAADAKWEAEIAKAKKQRALIKRVKAARPANTPDDAPILMPARNHQCPCGSRQKFKVCCEAIYPKLRKQGEPIMNLRCSCGSGKKYRDCCAIK